MNLGVDAALIQERNGCHGATSGPAWRISQATVSKQGLRMGVARQKKSHYVHQAESGARKTKPATDLICLVDLIIGGQCISPLPQPGQYKSHKSQLSTALLLLDESLVVGISNIVAQCLGLVQTLAQ